MVALFGELVGGTGGEAPLLGSRRQRPQKVYDISYSSMDNLVPQGHKGWHYGPAGYSTVEVDNG